MKQLSFQRTNKTSDFSSFAGNKMNPTILIYRLSKLIGKLSRPGIYPDEFDEILRQIKNEIQSFLEEEEKKN